MGEEQKDLIKVISAVIAVVIPAIIPIIKNIINYFSTNTKVYKENLIKFLEKVLVPIIQELRGKTFEEIDEKTINYIESIHKKNLALIPRYMDMRYTTMKNQFLKKGKEPKTYRNYYDYVYLTFLKVRKKLGYPRSSNIIYYKTMNFGEMLLWGLIYPIYMVLSIIFILREYMIPFIITIIITASLTFLLLSADERLLNRRVGKYKVKTNLQELSQQKSDQ